MVGNSKKAFCVVLVLAVFLSMGISGMWVSATTLVMLGEWSITANSYGGRINITNQSGSDFSGTVNIDSGGTQKLVSGRISGNTITFTRAWDSGTLRQDYTGTLTVSGEGSASMSGTFSQNGSGSYKWSATKTILMTAQTAPTPSGGLVPISGAVLNDQLNFKIDGKAVVPVGDDGTPVLPISYNGTTYLPVRAVGYLLKLGIDWEAGTNTVVITSTTTKPAPTPIAVAKTNSLIPISGALLNGELNFRLDGKAVVPVGDDGTPVLPISYNGTTYLPVRAMGYLLGLGIGWDAATNTVLITTASSAVGAAGWYFTHWEYYKDPSDTADTGPKQNRTSAGDGILEYRVGTGEKNNFTNKVWRTYTDGKLIASGEATTKWTDPPEYFSATDRPSITVNRTVESAWGISNFNVHFDMASINPGGGTSSYISFVTPDGQTHIQAYQGSFQMQKAIKGSVGAKKAIILYLNGHGFKYYYEWRE